MIHLENHHICISFNKVNGAISAIHDKEKDIQYVHENIIAQPFKIETEDEIELSSLRFNYSFERNRETQILKMAWAIDEEIEVRANVRIKYNNKEITFNYEVMNQSSKAIQSIEYPIIPNLKEITDNGEQDYLVHSYATGFEINQPMKNLNREFRYMPYPEGFSGSTMQFFSLYGMDKGGLYFAAYDSEGYSKWLNFYKNDEGLFDATFIHVPNNLSHANSFKVHYPIVIKLIDGSDWYESADIYKEWAIDQRWCRKGRLADVDNNHKATWLLEEIGVATFGINASHNRVNWIEAYHKFIDTEMFHILGPDWTNKKQDFINNLPGGLRDWIPTKFNQENIATFKKYGDKFSPFEFDYLFNVMGDEGDKGKEALQKMPTFIKSSDEYNFPFICPVEDFTKELHVQRDLHLKREEDIDAIYYDISANNILKVCMNENHKHPLGAGLDIEKAYWNNFNDTKDALISASNNRYIPMGTEMINERYLDVIDFYQARAGGRPGAPLEGWLIGDLIKENKARLIPLFTYIYHEYGGIRLDGWGKLTRELGDIFYHTVAKTYLWGGIYELNYEYSPMEMINNIENSMEDHYYPFEKRNYEFSENMAKYINQFALLRIGRGNKYLAYGKMIRPLSIHSEKISVSWNLYNVSTHDLHYNSQGQIDVDSVIHSAWQASDESIGLFFSNITEEDKLIELDLSELKLTAQSKNLAVVVSNYKGELYEEILELDKMDYYHFTILNREVLLFEINEIKE